MNTTETAGVYISQETAAELLGVSIWTIRHWHRYGLQLQAAGQSDERRRPLLYRFADVVAYVDELDRQQEAKRRERRQRLEAFAASLDDPQQEAVAV